MQHWGVGVPPAPRLRGDISSSYFKGWEHDYLKSHEKILRFFVCSLNAPPCTDALARPHVRVGFGPRGERRVLSAAGWLPGWFMAVARHGGRPRRSLGSGSDVLVALAAAVSGTVGGGSGDGWVRVVEVNRRLDGLDAGLGLVDFEEVGVDAAHHD